MNVLTDNTYMNIAKIISILILSFNITAVCAKTSIDPLCLKMAKDKKWARPNDNSNNIDIAPVLDAFSANSTNMKDQVGLYENFNNKDLHDCLRLNYGFSFKNKDLIITNKEAFSKLRLANKENSKGIACQFPDKVKVIEQSNIAHSSLVNATYIKKSKKK